LRYEVPPADKQIKLNLIDVTTYHWTGNAKVSDEYDVSIVRAEGK
jgi:hypothetical protein